MKRPNFPLVSALLGCLGNLPAGSRPLGLPVRELHHELTTVLGVAENAIQIVELTPAAPIPVDIVKPIPRQVREAMQATAELAKARGDHSAAHFLSAAALLLDDVEALKLRNMLR